MTNRNEEVDQFMAKLEHPLKAEIELVRSSILDASKDITEHIKWNAPSFCFKGDDRVTMRLQPKGRLQLIFHRGVKVKDSKGFTFEDSSGLLEWAAPDRGVLTLQDMKDVKAKKAALVKVVKQWMKSTSD
ncbi:DUF1801 domain-containing protein [Pyxidicoccus xibeiensis]|uniref:DUF1801 domain-containing protein n=1 Tax=Pyxidicoccus xibeiensis TaxID=2906759 RepID=UPI0020A6E6FE|nr:DUF1801 domain-containing protein [Pyxidicoccus xibeiensis]MCP3145355.1 DUF1801 domain-containing protein [Pyxidicoccus xibeiensis]